MGKNLLVSLIKVLFMMLLLSYKKYDSWKRFTKQHKNKFFLFQFLHLPKKIYLLFFYDQFLFLQLVIHLYFVQLSLFFFFFGTKGSSVLKEKKSKIRLSFLFLKFSRIKSSFVKVTEICFSLHLYKYFRENR